MSALGPQTLDKRVVARMLGDDGTFATTLLIICMASYPVDEVFEVDPLELILRLEEDYGMRVTDDNENKLKAILLCTATEAFYEDPETFRGTCQTLIDGDPGLDLVELPELAEAVWSMWEVDLNHGDRALAPRVQAVLHQVIKDEVLEMQEDEASDNPPDPKGHVWAIVSEWYDIFKNQLVELGVSASDIPPLGEQFAEQAAA